MKLTAHITKSLANVHNNIQPAHEQRNLPTLAGIIEFITNIMGTPDHKTNERRIQLGRGILRTLRQKHNDQWSDIHQIINGPQISEFFGEIERGGIDTAETYISRKNVTDIPKIETKTNEETAVEYSKSNAEHCKRKNQ